MKTTATITFHASHNYGSMLQAYALQQTLLSIGVSNEIINLRTHLQKSFYHHPSAEKGDTWKHRVWKRIRNLIYHNADLQLDRKYELFEKFLKKHLILTPEIDHLEKDDDLPNRYDYYITGSDQCWNINCGDFDWAYYLIFTESHEKIAYASSFGPHSHTKEGERIRRELERFKALSVREEGSADVVESLIGKRPATLPDPTLLVPREKWLHLAGEKAIMEKPYIFLYTPYFKKDINEVAVKMSKMLQLPILVSNFTSSRSDLSVLKRNGAKFKLDVGPEEFLNLIAHASLVVCGSFHAVVFSVILHVPFLAVNGDMDNRMSHLLDILSLESHIVHLHDINDNYSIAKPDFAGSDRIIQAERHKAVAFLKTNLDL